MPDNVPYWMLGGFYGTGDEGQGTGKPPPPDYYYHTPGSQWGEGAEDWTQPPPEEEWSPPSLYPEPTEDWEGRAFCENDGGVWANGNCLYPPASEEEIFSEFDCVPGTMYTDAQGQSRYCPQETSYGGLSTEVPWAAQGNPLIDILSQNPEFLQNFDISNIMSWFPDLGTEQFDLAKKGYQETLGEFRQEKGIQRRTMADILRGGSMEAGGELATSGFAGGGAYGIQAGKERKRSLRDYRQTMEGINLGMTEADIGFESTIDNIRYEYGEEIADIMSSLISSDMTGYPDEPCADGEVWMGEEVGCLNIEEEGGLEAILGV